MKAWLNIYRDSFCIQLRENEISSFKVVIQIKDGTGGETHWDVMWMLVINALCKHGSVCVCVLTCSLCVCMQEAPLCTH